MSATDDIGASGTLVPRSSLAKTQTAHGSSKSSSSSSSSGSKGGRLAPLGAGEKETDGDSPPGAGGRPAEAAERGGRVAPGAGALDASTVNKGAAGVDNGTLGAGVEEAAPGAGVAKVDSGFDAEAAAAFAAWCAAALARDLALAAGPRWQGRRAAPDAGAPR